MKRGKSIRLMMIVGSLCMAMWQIPKMLDHIMGAGDGGLLGGAVPGLAGAGDGAVETPGGLRVFTPHGGGMSDDELQRVLAEADRRAPIRPDDAARVSPVDGRLIGADGVDPSRLPAGIDPELYRRLLEQVQVKSGS